MAMEPETDGAERPVLSIIVPVRNGAQFLPRTLAALRLAMMGGRPAELIVVDDASTDSSADIAAHLADRVIRLPTQAGPAAARNTGAAAARGDILVFVDADVSVHRESLNQIQAFLSEHPEVDAVFGAYDASPAAPGLVSQYRNLLHHYVHHREPGETVTFWAGLGAVRRVSFERVGQFDDRQYLVEDIELGYRLSEEGHRIVLLPEIQGTHLKRWTLASMLVTDFWYRGVPWVRLLLDRRHTVRRATLNIQVGEQVRTGLIAAATMLLIATLITGRSRLILLAALAIAVTVASDWRFTLWLARTRGVWFAIRAVPLRLMYYALNVLSAGIGVLQAYADRRLPSALPASTVRQAGKSPA